MLNRFISILLTGCFLALGTGVLRYWHEAAHAREDAALAAAAKAAGKPVDAPPQHDESNCFIHAQLGQSITSTSWVPLLISLGLFVAFLSLLAPLPVTSAPVARLSCRGPPAFC